LLTSFVRRDQAPAGYDSSHNWLTASLRPMWLKTRWPAPSHSTPSALPPSRIGIERSEPLATSTNTTCRVRTLSTGANPISATTVPSGDHAG
jgi:hypothetical protein